MGATAWARSAVVAVALATLVAAALAHSASAAPLSIPPILNETTTTFPVKGTVRAVVVRTDMGQILVRSGSPSAITFHETWNHTRPTLTRSLKDGVLTVRATCPDDPTSFNKCSDDLMIVVPSAVRVDGATDFGDVTTKGLRGAEKLASDFGDITASRVSASTISAVTDHGKVDLGLITAPKKASARSSFGDVSVRVPSGTYAVSVKTEYGETSVTGLRQSRDATRRIAASSSYGDVTVAGR
jgi:hypothetical protein